MHFEEVTVDIKSLEMIQLGRSVSNYCLSASRFLNKWLEGQFFVFFFCFFVTSTQGFASGTPHSVPSNYSSREETGKNSKWIGHVSLRFRFRLVFFPSVSRHGLNLNKPGSLLYWSRGRKKNHEPSECVFNHHSRKNIFLPSLIYLIYFFLLFKPGHPGRRALLRSPGTDRGGTTHGHGRIELRTQNRLFFSCVFSGEVTLNSTFTIPTQKNQS